MIKVLSFLSNENCFAGRFRGPCGPRFEHHCVKESEILDRPHSGVGNFWKVGVGVGYFTSDSATLFFTSIGVRGGGRGGTAAPPGLKNFRANSVFRASASCQKILNDKKYLNTVKIFRATLFFRASASCSKILNNKKHVFSTVKSGHPVFFRASASYSKILNVKSIFNAMKKSRATLFFRASASCSKILNVKSIFNAVKKSRATLFFRASASCSNILNNKKYIQYSKKFQGKLFSGQAQVVKNPKCKKYIQYSEKFQGKRKLLKNRERWKNFQYSVYSLGGHPCNLGECNL